MKAQEFAEVKKSDIKTLLERAKALKVEIAQGVMDKNMNKLKDLKTVSRKRKNLAQILTVVRQKQLFESLESRVNPPAGRAGSLEKPKEIIEENIVEKKKGVKS